MTPPLIRILLLSDPAFSEARAWDQSARWAGLLETLGSLGTEGLAPDVVAVAGDVVDAPEGFDAAEVRLRELMEAVGLGLERLLLVPGERDIDPGALSRFAEAVADDLRGGGQPAIAELMGQEEERALLLRRLEPWLTFANRLRGDRPPLTRPWWSESLALRGHTVQVAGLCSSWVATGTDVDQGRLLIGEPQVQALLPPRSDAALRVALCHHPLSWLHQIDGGVEKLLAHRAALLLRGHTPEPEAQVHTRHDRPLVEVAAGAFDGDTPRFALVEVRADAVEVHPFCHLPQGWVRELTRAPPGQTALRLPGQTTRTTPKPPRPSLRPPPPLSPLPPEPYPVLAPYEHPATFGGRGPDLSRLLELLELERLVWTVYAPSGAGKSSLLRAGLMATLRGQTGLESRPAAYDALPAVPGVAQRLLDALLVDPPAVGDAMPDAFARALAQAREASGRRPVLVLDQFEDVFDTPALGWLGPLIAASAVAPGGRAARWVLAYRHEFHGRVRHWLGDVLRRADGGWPRDLSGPDTSVAWGLPLIGEARACDPRQAAQRAFAEAIQRPLQQTGPDGAPAYPLRIAPPDVDHLAAAFAQARLDHPEDPLTPELQVVLHRLSEDATPQPDGTRRVTLPDDPAAFVEDAIGEHLRRKLAEVASQAPPDRVRIRRTSALLLLARLEDGAGRRRALPLERLLDGLEPEARALVDELQRPGVWLIRQELRDGVPWASLPHDRVARELRRVLDSPGELVRFGLDSEGVGLWRLVDQRAAAWRSGDRGAVQLGANTVAALEQRQQSLPWDARTQAWWNKAVAVHTARDRDETLARVRASHPRSGEPLRALHRLRTHHGLDGAALAQALRVQPGRADALDCERREEILGLGPSGLSPEAWTTVLPGMISALAPHVEGAEQAEGLWGGLLALSEVLGHVAPEAAQETRAAVVAAMRAARGAPPPISEEDWSPVIAGRFEVGCFTEHEPDRFDNERLHAVVLSPYQLRRCAERLGDYGSFSPEHRERWSGYDADWPALQLNWYEATAYAAWRGARLPTESEWEVGARGGSAEDYRRTAYYNGNGVEALDRVGLYSGNQARIFKELGGQQPLKVGDTSVFARFLGPYVEHPLGLLHVHGNMAEWTRDWFAPYPEGEATDPSGPAVPPDPSQAWRVLRGGSWSLTAANARSAYRDWFTPSGRYNGVGLRLALPQPI
ncbi:MAG: SUMF1/EgtB/PvdO family nonheme iron enzyme [Alphaproteobacteria bacterium]|nr:SUMF1/EgtB/PvdO family nonheme iron enzyme [Alphaproteobacteria bacterium]